MSGRAPDGRDLQPVHWVGVPAQLYLDNLAHLRDLAHELRIVQAGRGAGAEIAAEAAALVDEVLASLARTDDDVERQAQSALETGAEVIDIVVHMTAAAVKGTERGLELLEAADELCRSGQLLTLPAEPEVVRFRRWTAEEVRRQLAEGAPPTSYRRCPR